MNKEYLSDFHEDLSRLLENATYTDNIDDICEETTIILESIYGQIPYDKKIFHKKIFEYYNDILLKKNGIINKLSSKISHIKTLAPSEAKRRASASP